MTFLTAQSMVSYGAESSIAGALPGDQDFPSLGITAEGGCAVWRDNRVLGGRIASVAGIAATRLDAGLTATGQVFRVSQLADGNQEKPQVLLLGNGNTLFAWEARRGAKPGVYARVLGTNGLFTSADVLVNTPPWKQSYTQTTNWVAFFRNRLLNRRYRVRVTVENIREQVGGVALAALPDGGALVAYHAARRTDTNTWHIQTITNDMRRLTNSYLRPVRVSENLMQDIFFQRLDSAGRKVGTEVLVNQYTAYNQRTPAVATLSDGRFVIVWVCEAPSTEEWRKNFQVDLYGRIFSAAGEPMGDEFPIAAEPDTESDLIQANPSVVALAGGGFAVFWSQQESTVSRRWDVYGGMFGADGMPTGSTFRLNEYTQGDQFGPKAAASGDRQLVVWTSVGQDGSREGVFGRFLASGALDGGELPINTTTINRQMHPTVSADGQGRFLSVWSGFAGETGFDLFGRILSGGGN